MIHANTLIGQDGVNIIEAALVPEQANGTQPVPTRPNMHTPQDSRRIRLFLDAGSVK